ncbi:MAG: OsmC family protein [Candidatus Heimdallarchaeota archaeon]
MEIESKWLEKYRFSVTNGRNDPIVIDVGPDYGGSGPAALELVIMALATCLGTTFKMIADKMQLTITAISVKATANKNDKDFITDIHMNVYVSSKDPKEKLEKTLELAEKNCPVDNIFQQTQIPVEAKLHIDAK